MIGFARRWTAVLGITIAVCCAMVAADDPAKPLLENERVRVTRLERATNASVPDDTRYDVVTVQIGEGKTKLVEAGQLEKPEPQGPGQVHYFVARSKRGVKNVGKAPVSFVQVQLLRPQGKYVAFEVPPTHYCNSGSLKACVTEQYLFCTDRFCAESVTLDPGAISTHHTHADDYIVIATSNFTWRDEEVNKPGRDLEFKAGDVSYIKAGATH